MLDIAYITPYYTADCEPIFARFLDWVHTLRDLEIPPYSAKVHSYVIWKSDDLVFSSTPHYLGDPEELFPSPKNRIEGVLNIHRLKKDIESQNPDIIHAISLNLPIYLLLQWIDIEAKVVIGPNIGGWNPIRPDDIWLSSLTQRLKYDIDYKVRRSYFNRLDYQKVVAFSNHHKRMLETFGVLEEEIIPVIPGVAEMFHTADVQSGDKSTYNLLFVGGLENDHKGYSLFLRALAKVDRNVNAQIVGGGDPQWDLINKLGIGDKLSIEGYVNRSDLPQIYSQCDLTVLPATDETGPTVKSESLASGTPVVATDEDGINEFSPPGSVVYFAPRTPKALSRAIEDAIDRLPQLRAVARDNTEMYGAKKILYQLNEIYSKI